MGKYVALLVLLIVLVVGAGGGLWWVIKNGGGSQKLPIIAPTPTGIPVVTTVVAEEGAAVVVEEIEVILLDSDPNHVYAVVRGEMEDSCSKLASQFVKLEGRIFEVLLSSEKILEKDCSGGAISFEDTVSLEVDGLEDGTYTVEVNGMSKGFSLGVEEATPTRANSRDIVVTPVSSESGVVDDIEN